VFILSRQAEDLEESYKTGKENLNEGANGTDHLTSNEIAFIHK
jgi:hypothetical protein